MTRIFRDTRTLHLLALVTVTAVTLTACTSDEQAVAPSPTPSPQVEIQDDNAATSGLAEGETQGAEGDTSQAAEPPFRYTLEGTLSDVTDGATLYGGYTTNPESSGVAQAGYNGERYQLSATFEDLPPAGEDAFYEGWVVTRFGSSVISTGELEQETETDYSNLFISEEDLTDHTRYVLTLEPRDGDPAPAEHVLEGTLQ